MESVASGLWTMSLALIFAATMARSVAAARFRTHAQSVPGSVRRSQTGHHGTAKCGQSHNFQVQGRMVQLQAVSTKLKATKGGPRHFLTSVAGANGISRTRRQWTRSLATNRKLVCSKFGPDFRFALNFAPTTLFHFFRMYTGHDWVEVL